MTKPTEKKQSHKKDTPVLSRSSSKTLRVPVRLFQWKRDRDVHFQLRIGTEISSYKDGKVCPK